MDEKIVMIKLVRVKYGRTDTKEDDKEYQINGKGPVGTFKEYQIVYPNAVKMVVG